MSNDKKDSSEVRAEKSMEAPGSKKRTVTVLLVKDEDPKTAITIEVPSYETEKDVVLRIFRRSEILKEHFGFEMSDECLVRISRRAGESHYLVEVKPLTISTPVRVTAVKDPPFQYVFEMKSPTVKPAENENFSHLFNSIKFSDVTLCIGERKIYAHKIVLANKSSVFDAMFESGCNKIEIQDFAYDTIFDLVHFIYMGKVTDDTDGSDLFRKFSNLLVADAKYRVDNLKEMSEVRLSLIITTENVLECLQLAGSYNGVYLKKHALDFAIENAEAIVKMPSFKDFDTVHPDLLVEMMRALIINKNNIS